MKEVVVKKLNPGDLPPAVRPFFESVKEEDAKLVAMFAAMTCYCGLSPRLRMHYLYDHPGKLSMPLVNLLVIGDSGVGKNMVDFVVDWLLQKMVARDLDERRKLREYKEKSKAKGANKDRGEEPLVAVRFLQKFTLPVGVKYCDLMYRKYGDWMPFFLFGSELGAFVENRRGSSEFQSVARTAFSMGEKYSRDTMYQDGYNAIVDLRWCSIICGQDQALAKYITKEGAVLGDAGRQMLVKLDDHLGEDRSGIRQFSDDEMNTVNQTIDMLVAETYQESGELCPVHHVDMSWIDKDVKHWCDQVRVQILKSGSRAMNSFYVRASVSAFRLATVMYHLWGEEPSAQKQVRRCYYFLAQFILDAQMAQWGKMYEAELGSNNEAEEQKPCLFDQLPNRFTRDMLRELIIREELGTEARKFIYKWLKRKWIYEEEKDLYVKIFSS